MTSNNTPRFTALASSIVDPVDVAHTVIARGLGHHKARKSPSKKLANSLGNDTSEMLSTLTEASVRTWLSRTVARSLPQALQATDEQVSSIQTYATRVSKLRTSTNAEQTDLMLRVGKYVITKNMAKLEIIRKEIQIRLTKQQLTTPIPGTFTTRTVTDPDEPSPTDKIEQQSRNSQFQNMRGF